MLPCSPSACDSSNSFEGADTNIKSAPLERNEPSKHFRWRPTSITNLVNRRRTSNAVFHSSPSSDTNNIPEPNPETALVLSSIDPVRLTAPIKKASHGTIVSIILVEAKKLPNVPDDGNSHSLYCKIRLGSQSIKSKSVPNSSHPEWRERFQFNLLKQHLLHVSLWDKGKQKNFMGSAVIDLLELEKERTHELWQLLDDGYGLVHLSITICNIRNRIESIDEEQCDKELQTIHALFNPDTNWKLVGQLKVRVISAKGLGGKPNAYCFLEVDNERVRTHTARSTAEPTWNKTFLFNVYDVTSTLDLKIYDTSVMISLNDDSLGRISIPLLRLQNGGMKWYALKDKSKRSSAKGNCPRVLLETSMIWNPIKASVRVFQPKEVKHIKKPPKFDVALVYKNMEFVRDTFVFLYDVNESYKRLFEWENQELSFVALVSWLLFWYHFKWWAMPLLLLMPFFYFWICNRHQHEKSFLRGYGIVDSSDKESEKAKPEKSLTGRITELPEMTLTITNGVNYLACLAEKLYNLASFKVPFLSYLTMTLLVLSSIGLYLIPFNYFMMSLGIYKFTRKYMRPERILNNDLEDFISRIPDTEELQDWKELPVPEPTPRNGITVGRHPYVREDTVMY